MLQMLDCLAPTGLGRSLSRPVASGIARPELYLGLEVVVVEADGYNLEPTDLNLNVPMNEWWGYLTSDHSHYCTLINIINHINEDFWGLWDLKLPV